MILFGILMGFASVYNATMTNVIDRRREWGTLKVLGYTNNKILKINVKEVFWSYLISIIPSVAISSGVCYVLGILMSNCSLRHGNILRELLFSIFSIWAKTFPLLTYTLYRLCRELV
ncbi:FtsX-like permease family protein [Pseudobacteroides sp.]|uniref:FtsX-like permease family protein n=1 Tax=Pseudobacteroides sp. TaxID=1968840 RepID=UPI0039C8E8CB